jgi:hypothetical protein
VEEIFFPGKLDKFKIVMKLVIWELKMDLRSYNCSPKQKKRAKGKKGVCMYTMSVNAPGLAHMKGDLQLQLPHSPHMHAKNRSLSLPHSRTLAPQPKDTTIISDEELMKNSSSW